MEYWAVVKNRSTKEILVLEKVDQPSKKVFRKEISKSGYDLVDGWVYNEEQWRESQKKNSHIVSIIEERKAKKRERNKTKKQKKRLEEKGSPAKTKVSKTTKSTKKPNTKNSLGNLEQYKGANVPNRFTK